MSTRPTPEEIIRKWGMEAAEILDGFDNPEEISPRLCIADLVQHGYRIVHPDDVPEKVVRNDHHDTAQERARGWNACRRQIFGDGA